VKSGPDVFADALVPIAEVSSGVFDFPKPNTRHRQSLRARAADAAFVRNGYRSAKSHGKPNLAIGRQGPQNKGLRDFAADGAAFTFTSRSSRYLNCPSNLIGHAHLNKPANGVGR
jgi:hypothetical protein